MVLLVEKLVCKRHPDKLYSHEAVRYYYPHSSFRLHPRHRSRGALL
jgi:hypothetical protein